jgi:ABC-type branched-subunit amino acid transport system substrate-binding protein
MSQGDTTMKKPSASVTTKTRSSTGVPGIGRREFLRSWAALAGLVALGDGSFILSSCSGGSPRNIKVGVITDVTGPLSFMGVANANVARMVIDDLNAKGGLLGRQIDLYLEDSETTDSVAEAKAAKLVQQDHVDVILGGIFSSTRQAIKGPAVVNGKKLYIYPEQYEGQECDPLIFCTGPVPAQQVEPFIPWLMQQTGATKFYLPSADYIWPHTMNAKVREVATAHGGEIVGEEYFPLDQADYSTTIDAISSSGAEVVFNTIVPPGLTPFLEQLYDSGFSKRGGYIVCTYFDENLLNLVPAEQVEGLYSCLDYYQSVGDPFSKKLLDHYAELYPGEAKFTAGSGCTGMYRGLKLWEAAVKEAGSLDQAKVIKALNHATIAEGPGGPAEMVAGQHHVRMNMFIAQARNGRFEVIENLGVVDPKECVQGIA